MAKSKLHPVTKFCKYCRRDLILSEFNQKRIDDPESGLRAACINCNIKSRYKKAEWEKPGFKPKFQRKKDRHGKVPFGTKAYKTSVILYHRYKINLEAYNEMFLKQQGCCDICGKHQSTLKKTLAVDHNHKTGKVRSLLCNRCNQGIGSLDDSIELLLTATNYLKKYED